MMYDWGAGPTQSWIGKRFYRKVRVAIRVTCVAIHVLLHLLPVIQSGSMGASGGKLTGSLAGLSSLPVNESRGFRCNALLDQPLPWYKCCLEESSIVGFFPPPIARPV